MSYRNLIDAQVRKAFTLLKDLAEDVVLTKTTSSDFNFGTGEASITSPAPVVTKAVIVDSKKKSKDRNTTEKLVLMKTQYTGDISLYDSFSYKNEVWKFGDIISNDGHITVATVFRET
jgi:hypothetical protein